MVLLLPGLAMASASVNHKFTADGVTPTTSTIHPGDVATYTIEIVNDSTTSALTNVNLTSLLTMAAEQYPGQPLPSIQIVSPVTTSNTCGGTLTTAAGGTSVILTGGTVSAAADISTPGSCTITVKVTSLKTGNQIAHIPASTTPTNTTAGLVFKDGVDNEAHNLTFANASLLVTPLSAPTGSKQFSPSPSYVGRATALTITLTNPNADATMPLDSFTDALPSGMFVATVPNASVVCSGADFANGAVTAVAGSQSVSLAGGTIGKSGTCVITVDVVVPELAGTNTTQTYTNKLEPGAIKNGRGLESPQFERALTVNAPVSVSKGFSPGTIPVGATSTMSITVTNNGGEALTNAGFKDTFPSTNLQILSTPAPAISCSGGSNAGTAVPDTLSSPNVLTVSGMTVPANGGTCTVTVPVTANAENASGYVNSLPANAVTNDQNIGSPAASGTLTAYSQLRVAKSVSLNQVAPGQWTEFTVAISNYSSGAVTNAVFTDSLPAGMTYVAGSATVNPTACNFTFASTGTGATNDPVVLKGTGGVIPAATNTTPGVCTVKFKAQLPSTATVGTSTYVNQLPTNTAVVGNGIGGSTTNTNPSSANSVATVDAVDLNKAFSPNSIAAGQTSKLTITVYNRTLNALTITSLTDNLPPGLELAADPQATTTCTGGSLQAYPQDTKMILSGATVLARPDSSKDASCVITAMVTGKTASTTAYVNTIKPADFTSSAGTIPANRSANLTITAGLTATKNFYPSSVATGGVTRSTVTVSNTTNGQLTNVSVNDDGLAGGLVVANPANASTSCGGTPVLTANPGTTGVRLDGVTLNAGASCILSFDVLASGNGPWSNTIAASKITSAEGAYNTQVAAATLGNQSVSLALSKNFDPLVVTGNKPSTLTIDVVNSSNVAIEGVAFTDTFPQGVQIYATPDASTTCSGATVAATPGNGSVSLAGAKLAANSTCQVFVKVTSVSFLNLTNTIPAKAVTSQGGYTNAQPTSATLTTLQGLGISKGFEPAYIAANAVSRLKIKLVSTFDPSVINPVVLKGVTFTDKLPAGLGFATTPNATTTCADGKIMMDAGAGQITVSGATLAPGASCDLEVNVTAGDKGDYLNSIPTNSVKTDQGVTNPDPGESTLHVVPDPEVTKMFNTTDPVKVGAPVELIVTVKNNATVPMTGVSLTDNLPPNMAVAENPNVSTTCMGGTVTANPGATSFTLKGATVAAANGATNPVTAGTCVFRAFVVANKSGSFKNTIGPNAITSDQGLTNGNPTEADLEVLDPPAVTKSFTPVQIQSTAPDNVSTLRIRLENQNKTPITLTKSLVDALPGDVFVAATPNINGNLAGATACSGAVTANANDIKVTYANGATIPVGGCTISVDVTSSKTGNYLNTIAAGQLETTAGVNPEPANATLGVDEPAAPSVDKAFNPEQIDVNGISTLTIMLNNPNTVPLTLSKDLVDALPTDVVVAATPHLGGTCPGNKVADANSLTVSYLTDSAIPAGGCTIIVDVTSSKAGSYTNIIRKGDLGTKEAGSNPNDATAGLIIKSALNPTVLKAFSPGTINPGGVSKLTITLDNPNAAVATLTADMVDTMPTEVKIADPLTIGGSCTNAGIVAEAGGDTVTYQAGNTIPAKGSCTITVNVTSTVSGGPYTNTIHPGDLKTDKGDNIPPTTADLIVNPGQPPSVSKSFAPTIIVAGQESTLTIKLGNGGTTVQTLKKDMTDALVDMSAVIPANTTGTTCDINFVSVSASSVKYLTGGSIPVGGCVIAVRVTSSVAGVHPNTIPAGELETEMGVNPIPTTADLTVGEQTAAEIASISGHVYHDRNDDGSIGKGEEGISGVTIELRSATDGSLVFTTTTDSTGYWEFPVVAPGTYTVVEIHPEKWVDGKDTAGSHGGTAGNDVITSVTLKGGDVATDYNFGELRPVSSGVTPVPTLSQWSLIALASLLCLMALWQNGGVRRRK
ncbi:IPTL-CTERM sorting domain-containing protein [Diaphorobacter sp. HDW4A]|uniref:IPTL-CTERM sorting domain-containing protein n=1 Tax=Diaphorobacter sp. HDW4A TaxID=2714924 RepID=UPI00140D4B79|nr:IPTL-CTERM sorting domain-containing protein [Diaphorobacter sp. HDW4A]QIL82537.1 IPTL-CTERM sorting domain-containing protein [Diaphorobacter sp. HDW4A]